MQKIWNLKKYNEDEVKKICNEYDVSETMAKFLISRNIGFEDIKEFLIGDISNLKDPFLIKDMEKFVNRVSRAIKNNERICIYGDYDVDGITSITIMYKFLKDLGADVIYYLPNRLLEGYGINNGALDVIREQEVKLIITVDCGITAVEQTEYARSLGMDVCITDHHECSEVVPNAVAIVNPKQLDDKFEFKYHAGVGVAFKCIMALSKVFNLDENEYMKFLDIVAIGTISDIVPLVGENRIISKYGLKLIPNTQNIGIKSLIKVINCKEIDSTMVSFGIAPRVNACGRMGNAKIAVELLLEQDEQRAYELALELDKLNTLRQKVEKDIFDEAVSIIQKNRLDLKNSIVLYNEHWHNGVIGIVASRLVNIYCKPVILFTKENSQIRGSGRCQSGVSLYDCLTYCKDLLIQFGGHELAAGLSIEEENINKFANKFEEVVTSSINENNEQIIDIDMEISKSDLNIQLIKDIWNLKPYGQANKIPLFLYRNLKVQAIRTLKDDKHLKFTLRDDKFLIEALAFSQGDRRDEVKLGDKIDVICNVELNSYNTPKTVQLILQDFKKSIN